jgi:hypothetical protein
MKTVDTDPFAGEEVPFIETLPAECVLTAHVASFAIASTIFLANGISHGIHI